MKAIFDEFIRMLKQKTPEGMNPVDLLIEIIPMSKEAAYRRLRGQINFTLTEILKIAQQLDISLDNLIKTGDNQYYRIKVANIKEESFMENHIECLEKLLNFIIELKNSPVYHITSVNNNIPMLYLFNYRMISKFRLYKWKYQRNTLSKPIRMSEFHIPAKVISLEKTLLKELRETQIHFIYGQELLKSLTKDINYFRHLDLISEEEVDQLKQEAFSLLENIEHDAILGKNRKVPCNIHVTNVNFDNDFVLWYNDKFSKITFRLFGVNYYSIDNPEAINEMNNWINMLLKSSTQISFSGEKKRMEFFQYQRLILELL